MSAQRPSSSVVRHLIRNLIYPGKDIGVGGSTLAAAVIRLGLMDEYRLFVNPILVGGGTPFFPPLDGAAELELVETRTFGSRVVYLRYRRAG